MHSAVTTSSRLFRAWLAASDRPDFMVIDPACGSGAFIIEAMGYMRDSDVYRHLHRKRVLRERRCKRCLARRHIPSRWISQVQAVGLVRLSGALESVVRRSPVPREHTLAPDALLILAKQRDEERNPEVDAASELLDLNPQSELEVREAKVDRQLARILRRELSGSCTESPTASPPFHWIVSPTAPRSVLPRSLADDAPALWASPA